MTIEMVAVPVALAAEPEAGVPSVAVMVTGKVPATALEVTATTPVLELIVTQPRAAVVASRV